MLLSGGADTTLLSPGQPAHCQPRPTAPCQPRPPALWSPYADNPICLPSAPAVRAAHLSVPQSSTSPSFERLLLPKGDRATLRPTSGDLTQRISLTSDRIYNAPSALPQQVPTSSPKIPISSPPSRQTLLARLIPIPGVHNRPVPSSGDLNRLAPTPGTLTRLVPTAGDLARLVPTPGDLARLVPSPGDLIRLVPTPGDLTRIVPTPGDLARLHFFSLLYPLQFSFPWGLQPHSTLSPIYSPTSSSPLFSPTSSLLPKGSVAPPVRPVATRGEAGRTPADIWNPPGLPRGLSRKHGCRFCGKMFPRSANLTRHLRSIFILNLL